MSLINSKQTNTIAELVLEQAIALLKETLGEKNTERLAKVFDILEADKFLTKLQEKTVDAIQEACPKPETDDEESDDEKPKKKSKKSKKSEELADPNKPKLPLSTYIRFSSEMRKMHKYMLPTDLASKWTLAKELAKAAPKKPTSEEKELIKIHNKVVTEYNKEKAKYDEDMENYERPSDAVLAKLQAAAPAKKPKKSSSKKVRDPDAPKAPASAWNAFRKDKTTELKENSDMDYKQALSEASRIWKKETSKGEEKGVPKSALVRKYKETYEKAAVLYRKALEKYEANKSKDAGSEAEEAEIEPVASEEEEVKKPAPKSKGDAPKTKAAAPSKPAPKASSEDESSEDEKPAKPKAAPSKPAPKPAAKAAPKKADSDDESSEDEKPAAKAAPSKPAPKKAVKVSSEDEEPKPKPKAGKSKKDDLAIELDGSDDE